MGRTEPFQLALDIGCGAGVSTKALNGFARSCIGLDPIEAMLKWTSTIAPFARFVVGTAEAIPLRDHSVDLITAAGSLNYVNLDLFFPEAARVLMPDGVLVAYDFSPGRSFSDATSLDEWFSSFYSRYPPPENEAQALSPAILAEISSGFRVLCRQQFEVGITLSPTFYLDYMMTETNVAAALRSGAPRSEIKSWCAETLAPVWNGAEREVLFRGYFASMRVA
ncbi:MAG TPA: class I SAM-dependent methyltransferase [Bryobacteraceae bacterium]|nr:class I SAM-dependent methyltransferase [Bryobacteraceae bacterium]